MRLPKSPFFSYLCLWSVLSLSALSPNAPRPALAQGGPTGYEPPEISLEELARITGEPTRVTFSGKDITPQVAAAAIIAEANMPPTSITSVRHTGYPATISVDWKNVPFWDAAKEIETLTGLRWSGPRDLPFYPITLQPIYNDPHAGLNGEVLAQIPCLRFLSSTTGGLTLYLDPKLSVTMVSLKELKGTPQEQYAVSTMSQGRAKVAGTRITLPDGKTPLPVSGILHFHLFSTIESLHIPNFEIGSSATLRDGSASLSVRDASYQDNQLLIEMILRRPHGFLSATETYLSLDMLKVRDGAGNLLRRRNSTVGGVKGQPRSGSEGVSILFETKDGKEKPQGPFTIDWFIPLEERCVNIPFDRK